MEKPVGKYFFKQFLAIAIAMVAEPFVSTSASIGMLVSQYSWKWFPLGRIVVFFILFQLAMLVLGKVKQLKTM